MALWLKSGSHDIGVEGGVIRRADFAEVLQACELGARAAAVLADAQAEAARIVGAATERARVVLHEAEGEAERLRVQGHEAGLREAAARWAEKAATKAFADQSSVLRASERLAELVSLAAQRVIEQEDKQGLYRRALRTVQQLAHDTKTLVLHIGADDADHARAIVAELASEVGIEVPLDVRVDVRLPTGGCVLESDYGVIDASMGLQIEAIRKAIGKAARASIEQAPTERSAPPARSADVADEPVEPVEAVEAAGAVADSVDL
jgi:type III secretion protein L